MSAHKESGPSSRTLVWAGAALMLIGIGVALALFWPDIAFRAGLVRSTSPYPSRFDVGDRGASRPVPADDRLVVPRIALDAPIFEGSPASALERGVYHYPETAAPGQDGNAVIAGHRVRRAFTLLYLLSPGDDIIVYWHGVEYDYRVVSVHEVGPDATGILVRGTAEKLTLYTCTPRLLGNKRTVVVAEPIAP